MWAAASDPTRGVQQGTEAAVTDREDEFPRDEPDDLHPTYRQATA